MKCMNCGADNPDMLTYCQNCGQPLAAQEAQPQQPYQQQPYQQQPYQQQPYQQQPYMYNQPVNPMDPYHGHSMKWYKFLVYFALIASAVMYVVNAIRYFTTGNYTVNGLNGKVILSGTEAKEWMYAGAPGLKGADIFYGITLLLSAALLIYTWYNLYKKKAAGPKYLYISYGFNAATSVIYSIWVFSVAKDVLESPTTVVSSAIATAAIAVVMIIVNMKYFNNRKDIFVN